MDDLTIGERLEDVIKTQGIKQKQLAEKTGLSESLISDLINGTKHRKVNHEAIIRLCNALNISSDYILGLSKIQSNKPNVRSAVQLTGLSEKALDNLCGMQCIPLLDRILSENKTKKLFEDMLLELAQIGLHNKSFVGTEELLKIYKNEDNIHRLLAGRCIEQIGLVLMKGNEKDA